MAGVPPKFLVGAHEIAERLNLSHAPSVDTIRKRHAKFPAPVATLKTALNIPIFAVNRSDHPKSLATTSTPRLESYFSIKHFQVFSINQDLAVINDSDEKLNADDFERADIETYGPNLALRSHERTLEKGCS